MLRPDKLLGFLRLLSRELRCFVKHRYMQLRVLQRNIYFNQRPEKKTVGRKAYATLVGHHHIVTNSSITPITLLKHVCTQESWVFRIGSHKQEIAFS